MTHWIGLTGGIGSGKSTAAAHFARLGTPIIDTDQISRNLTAENGAALPQIRQTLGDTVFTPQGTLDRPTLRRLVFQDTQARTALENILYPHIIQTVRLQQTRHPEAHYGIIEIPLLFEKPRFQTLISRTLTIHADETVKIRRIQTRSRLTETEIRQILQTQMPDRDRLIRTDDALANNHDTQELQTKIQRLHRYYQNL